MELMVNLVERDMMRILQTGRCKINSKLKTQNLKLQNSVILDFEYWNWYSRRGFTLIELIIVIFIISLTAALIMPSLWKTTESTVKAEARHISGALRYIHDEAVGKKQVYLFKINFDNDSWGFEGEKESRNFKLKGDVELKDVLIPSLGEISKGQVIVKFGPMGSEEPIIIHLMKDESEYTVIFNHLSGRAKIVRGYAL
jgi:general secretion pathway protein H